MCIRDRNKHYVIYNDCKLGRSNLVIAMSRDGKRWDNILNLETAEGEYSYPSIIKGENDSLHIVYTWNRERIKYVYLDNNDIPN